MFRALIFWLAFQPMRFLTSTPTHWLNCVGLAAFAGNGTCGRIWALQKLHWCFCAKAIALSDAWACFKIRTKSWTGGWPRLRWTLSITFVSSASDLLSDKSGLAASTSWTHRDDHWGHGARHFCFSIRNDGTVSITASTNCGVYLPANLLILPTSGWDPAIGWWHWWCAWFAPGHNRSSTFMSSWETSNCVALRINLVLLGILKPYLHIWHVIRWWWWINFWTSAYVHNLEPLGCSNKARPPALTCCSNKRQQNLMNNRLWLTLRMYSFMSMVHEFRWNQPPSSVQGGHKTNKSGRFCRNSSATASRTSAFEKSYPVVKSKDLHEPWTPWTKGAKRGGQKTSATTKGSPSTWDDFSDGCRTCASICLRWCTDKASEIVTWFSCGMKWNSVVTCRTSLGMCWWYFDFLACGFIHSS